jgi:large subunit ribosomal protein L22
MSAYKAREVLDLIRGEDVQRAEEILRFSERDAARVIRKCLASAVANAEHNDGLPADELFVASCYADEGVTIKRWRPRARGRATRIRKRTCHITVIVGRLDPDALERRRERDEARPGSRASRRAGQQAAERRRRVALSRRRQRDEEHEHEHDEEGETPEAEAPETEVAETEVAEAEAAPVEPEPAGEEMPEAVADEEPSAASADEEEER